MFSPLLVCVCVLIVCIKCVGHCLISRVYNKCTLVDMLGNYRCKWNTVCKHIMLWWCSVQVVKACESASVRDGQSDVTVEDVLFLMRRDKVASLPLSAPPTPSLLFFHCPVSSSFAPPPSLLLSSPLPLFPPSLLLLFLFVRGRENCWEIWDDWCG